MDYGMRSHELDTHTAHSHTAIQYSSGGSISHRGREIKNRKVFEENLLHRMGDLKQQLTTLLVFLNDTLVLNLQEFVSRSHTQPFHNLMISNRQHTYKCNKNI